MSDPPTSLYNQTKPPNLSKSEYTGYSEITHSLQLAQNLKYHCKNSHQNRKESIVQGINNHENKNNESLKYQWLKKKKKKESQCYSSFSIVFLNIAVTEPPLHYFSRNYARG